jgi:hypothetical protein
LLWSLGGNRCQSYDTQLIHTNYLTDNVVQIQLAEVNEMISTNLYRFYGLVKTLLPRQQAASSLGLIIRHAGVTFGDALIDFEVEAALNTLNRHERDRQFALMILSELAKNSPGNFYKHVELVLEQIWVPLRDARVSSEVSVLGAYVLCANHIYRSAGAYVARSQACCRSAYSSVLGHSVHPRQAD